MNALKIQIEALAPYAELNPRMLKLLQRSFLMETTTKEDEEIVDWKSRNDYNKTILGLLSELAYEEGTDEAIALIEKLAKDKPAMRRRMFTKVGKASIKVLSLLALASIILFVYRRWDLAKGLLCDMPFSMSVETGDDPKTFWLSDSTRVDLAPHSTLIYPEHFKCFRKVLLIGHAKFEVRNMDGETFRVESARNWVARVVEGTLVVREDEEGMHFQQIGK